VPLALPRALPTPPPTAPVAPALLLSLTRFNYTSPAGRVKHPQGEGCSRPAASRDPQRQLEAGHGRAGGCQAPGGPGSHSRKEKQSGQGRRAPRAGHKPLHACSARRPPRRNEATGGALSETRLLGLGGLEDGERGRGGGKGSVLGGLPVALLEVPLRAGSGGRELRKGLPGREGRGHELVEDAVRESVPGDATEFGPSQSR